MAESIVQVTEGSGKKLHTYQRTIGASSVEDEIVIPGEHYLASYVVVPAAAVTGANTGDDILQIMAGASLNVRIRRIRFEQEAVVTTAAPFILDVMRVTSAGTGGTAITPAKFDTGDAASGATAASGVPNATHGTAGTLLMTGQIWPVQTSATGGSSGEFWEWSQHPGTKPIIIAAGTTNGIVLRNRVGRAGITLHATIEFVETSFL